MRVLRSVLVFSFCLAAGACGGPDPDALALGATVPEFSLHATDGRTRSLREFADAPVLAVVFTSNTCPVSQLYEARIQKLHDDYRARGVAVVAINANKPSALQLADLRHTDVGDAPEDMKVRAAHRRLTYPYLSDGDTQAVVRQFGVTTVPHVFVFDRERKLQYRGRIDDDVRGAQVKSPEARQAVDALLAGQPPPVTKTAAVGCAVKGMSSVQPDAELAQFTGAPVNVQMAGADELKRLRQNGTGKLLIVNFWATWCVPCEREFPDLEATYRRFKPRNVEFVSVSVNDPEEKAAVLAFLQKQQAGHDNRLFASSDVYGLQAAFDPKMPSPVPFTLLLAPNGDVLYQELGELDVVRLRRAILANLADDPRYPGQQAYWSTP
jgi:peroxiredoxin